MVAWSDLEYWRSSYLDESANAGGDGRRRTRTQVEELAGHFDRFRSEGQAADAMRGAGTALQDDLDHLVQVASEYMLACEEAADGVRRVEAKARSAQEISPEIGYPIKEDGSLDPFVREYENWTITVPGTMPTTQTTREQSYASIVKELKYGELQQCIADALRIAEEVDAALEKRLSALANGTFDGGGAREGRDSKSPGLPDDADPSWSPAEVSAWWHALSDAERQECIERDPATYGNLDGIDMASRDKANRLVLHGYTDSGGNHVPGLIEKAEAAVAAAQDKINNAGYQSPRESDLGAALRLDLENAQHDLEELRRLDAQLQRTGTDGAPTSLLVLDPSGERLKAAVAVGVSTTRRTWPPSCPAWGPTSMIRLRAMSILRIPCGIRLAMLLVWILLILRLSHGSATTPRSTTPPSPRRRRPRPGLPASTTSSRASSRGGGKGAATSTRRSSLTPTDPPQRGWP